VPPLQQPLGHEVASQTHCPVALHSWPVPQAAQLAPPVPQDDADSEAYASQVPLVPPLQQPFGHVRASHAQRPLVVSHRLLAQATQAAPPVPQALLDSEA
jgi:hypothetical protein